MGELNWQGYRVVVRAVFCMHVVVADVELGHDDVPIGHDVIVLVADAAFNPKTQTFARIVWTMDGHGSLSFLFFHFGFVCKSDNPG